MSEPVEYQIVRNLQAALLAVAVSAGYHYNLVALAVKLDPNHDVETLIAPDGPRPFAVIEVHQERRDYDTISRGAVKILRPVTVHWISDAVPTEDEARMQMFFRGCADVERAVTRDRTRGNLALDTLVQACEFDTAVDGAQVWAKVGLEIKLQRTYGEPNV